MDDPLLGEGNSGVYNGKWRPGFFLNAATCVGSGGDGGGVRGVSNNTVATQCQQRHEEDR